MTYLEESAAGAAAVERTEITTEIVEQAVDKAAIRYDRDGDQHYDVISAFIKSIRGSDVQASCTTWLGWWRRERIRGSSPAGW